MTRYRLVPQGGIGPGQRIKLALSVVLLASLVFFLGVVFVTPMDRLNAVLSPANPSAGYFLLTLLACFVFFLVFDVQPASTTSDEHAERAASVVDSPSWRAAKEREEP